MLSSPYYAKNYAGIIDSGLPNATVGMLVTLKILIYKYQYQFKRGVHTCCIESKN